MMGSPFTQALEAALGPLRFAARDDFAGLDKVKGLEASVERGVAAAAALAVPKDVQRTLARVAEAFQKPLEGDARRKVVSDAVELLEPMATGAFAESLFDRPLTVMPGVGPKRAETLAKRGLRRVSDLLFYLPVRYDDRRALVDVENLEVGRRATFTARVLMVDFVPQRSRGGRFRQIFQAVVGDDSGATVSLKWFYGGEALQSVVKKGNTLLITGDVRRYRFQKELMHPDVDAIDVEGTDVAHALEGLERVVADYPTLERVPPRTLRRLIAAALAEYADLATGHLPAALVKERGLPAAADALRGVHMPPSDSDVDALREHRSPAHERLVLEELFLLEAGLALRRASLARQPGITIAGDGPRARCTRRVALHTDRGPAPRMGRNPRGHGAPASHEPAVAG